MEKITKRTWARASTSLLATAAVWLLSPSSATASESLIGTRRDTNPSAPRAESGTQFFDALPFPFTFEQFSPNGFISSEEDEAEGRHNSYAWSMDVLPGSDADYLYVGSNRDYLYEPLVKAGEELGYSEAEVLEFFGGDLAPPHEVEGFPDYRGRLFRCRVDDPDAWETAYISPVI